MTIPDVIITLVILAAVGLSARYIYKEKKRGTRCVGCPFSGECTAHIEEILSDCTLNGGKCSNDENSSCCSHAGAKV